jgi:hypothetical protein
MADSTPVKPGWKTTEFWLSAAATITGLLLASGAINSGSGFDKVIGVVASALAAMGYAVSRGNAKSGQ